MIENDTLSQATHKGFLVCHKTMHVRDGSMQTPGPFPPLISVTQLTCTQFRIHSIGLTFAAFCIKGDKDLCALLL